MGSSELNRGIMSSLIGDKKAKFQHGDIFHLNLFEYITTKVVISQIKFL